MKRRFGYLTLTAVLSATLFACSDDAETPILEPTDPVAERIAAITAAMPTSLHATAEGMRNWYIQPNGYGQQIGVDYETLPCGNCHVPQDPQLACAACHEDVEAAALGTEEMDYKVTCLDACHGRQKSEVGLGLPDVHREAGMGCGDCHTSNEIHGNGQPHSTMFDEGVFEVRCVTCHVEGGEAAPVSTRQEHTIHGDELSCEACHQAASVSCYNCHFEDEIVNHRKVAYGKFSDWVFLGNYRGKVYPMNFQSVEYQGETFAAWGPFHGHTITREARDCNECHGNQHLVDYDRDGMLKVVEWDEGLGKLTYRRGIIPLTPDFQESFLFDFVSRNAGGPWYYVETGPDNVQLRFGTPLTARQIDLLRIGM